MPPDARAVRGLNGRVDHMQDCCCAGQKPLGKKRHILTNNACVFVKRSDPHYHLVFYKIIGLATLYLR